MNKSESKYFNTSLLMNQALIELLNKKEFEFITVKEICKKAGVNRSTFYLHYDKIGDLLCETIENLNKQFFSCFSDEEKDISKKIRKGKREDLILITPQYLLPYLNHVKENKVVYKVSAKYPILMQSVEKYKYLQNEILFPIFESFDIGGEDKKFISAYYINGIYAIIDEWISGGCREDVSKICKIIIDCVRPFESDDGFKGKDKKVKE